MQGWRFLQNHYTLAVGSVNAAAADCCMKLSRMTAAPTAKTTAVKQATVKARIFFLLIIKSLAQLQVASVLLRQQNTVFRRHEKTPRFRGLQRFVRADQQLRKNRPLQRFRGQKRSPRSRGRVAFKKIPARRRRARKCCRRQAPP